ncbi:Asp23/Gls24 family envelope stress response protein [Streptomyces spinosirectus]|uniref:Asp23/Gls24 family envelope stress response protein n=1 Tax=Streptomyces TaxID=1883 RepID=UPI001C9DCA1B|nr:MULTISPECIES: Asp23/Gls24 family envelope stress response protein [Streptomyces]MBY8342242.1 Asp23/Gls24 family envelope stress response protein [Streptomyces plumbidurans]UIR17244.1 Asp23/Gls24 family envelope stress response protein [Streptomyces spinosirectus]
MTPVSDGVSELHRPLAAVEAAERGATRIADRVVSKIAAQAAREMLADLPKEAAAPHASVVVRHHTAHVRVHVELGYPCDIGGRCADVRRHVALRVRALVGMEVPEVAVHVERLHLTPAHGAAQGRTR